MDYRDRKPHKCKRTYQGDLDPRLDPYLQFVVHEHDAWKYHFDFRFELGNGLRDFVVPRGPSTDPSVRRHAFSYHDHDIRCLKMEHGGDGRKGAMLAWDRGFILPYYPVAGSQEEAIWIGLEQGHLEFELFGQKLKGKWGFIADGCDWVWQKVEDEYASTDDILQLNRSVISGKTLKELYWANVLWLDLLEFYIPDRSISRSLIVHRDGFVLDRNRAARDRNVHPGLELKKAKAILQDTEFIPWEAEKYLRRQAEWLDICTLFSNTIEPADQHQAWVDLSMHPDAVGTAEELIRRLVQQTGLPIQSGMSPTKWISQLAARHHDAGIDAQIDPRAFVAGLHIRELLPVEPETRERLSFLGYAKIGEAARIPLKVLKEQFGPDAHIIHTAANGGVHQPVEAAYPPESCLERFAFDGRAESTEIIHNGLVALAERIGARLERQNLEGTLLTITLETEEGEPRRLERTFSKPIRDSRSALASLCLLLEKELDIPLTAILALVSKLRKTQVAQGEFLVRQTRTPQRLESMIQRAHKVYGEQSIRRGKEIQLPRRILVLREWKHATGWY